MNDTPSFRRDSIETLAKRKWLHKLLSFAHIQIQNVRYAHDMQLGGIAYEYTRDIAGMLYIAYLITDPPYEDDLLELSSQVVQEVEKGEHLNGDKLNKLDQSIILIRDGIDRA